MTKAWLPNMVRMVHLHIGKGKEPFRSVDNAAEGK
jgi:hypothetical protein